MTMNHTLFWSYPPLTSFPSWSNPTPLEGSGSGLGTTGAGAGVGQNGGKPEGRDPEPRNGHPVTSIGRTQPVRQASLPTQNNGWAPQQSPYPQPQQPPASASILTKESVRATPFRSVTMTPGAPGERDPYSPYTQTPQSTSPYASPQSTVHPTNPNVSFSEEPKTIPATRARRTKTVQDMWFGGIAKDDSLVPNRQGAAGSDEEDDDNNSDDQDDDGEQGEDENDIIVKDGGRDLTLEWAKGITKLVSTSSGVGIEVSLARPTLPAVEGNVDGESNKGPYRFLFRFSGVYAKVLVAKSALRKELVPEAKAEVSFPLTQVYSLSALFPTSSVRSMAGTKAAGLSPNAIIPEVRAKLNDIAMKTGVLLTIDDPVVRRYGSAGSLRTADNDRDSSGPGTPQRGRRGTGLSAAGKSAKKPVRNGTDATGQPQQHQAQPADNGVVVDSPESLHAELPSVGQDGAGVIGQKPPSRQGSRQGSFDIAPRSATSSRFFPTNTSSSGGDPNTNSVSTPSPISTRFSGIMDREQLQEELLNQTFENIGFIKQGTCVIVLQGLKQAVAAAKTLLLVLSDELNGLHVETIDIPERLQRIIAGRKNGQINHIMGTTETNIYVPEGRLVQAEDLPSYGSLSPIMSPPLRYSPFLGSSNLPLGGATSPGLGAGFGSGPTNGPITGIPGLMDPTVPDLATSLNTLSLHQNQTSSAVLSPTQMPLTLSPTPTQTGWMSPGTVSPGMHLAAGFNRNTVYITGSSAVRVLNAKEWLLRMAFEKNAGPIVFQSPVSPRKLDWLMHEKAEQVMKIMFDNGCTVRLQPGNQVGMVQVLGDHEVSIRRTMKQVIRLVTDTCLAAAWMITTNNVTTAYDTEYQARLLAIETDVEMAAGALCIEAFSGEPGISGARRVFDLLENPTNSGYNTHIQFQVQPLIDHQDFLGGKGMGKIVSMSRKSNAKIQLVPASDRLFTLDIRSDSFASVAIALGVLQEELPAETSFYLPEAYHRKIIGRNGKNIQEIMYRHNVAVRFSSSEQWADFGGHQDNEDNVLIITPAKNAAVIERVKDIVMEHVPEETRYYAPRYVSPIPRAYHASIQANPALHQWQDKFGAAIRCLPKERGTDSIEVYSSSAVLPALEPILKSLVPLERLAVIRTNVHPLDLSDWHTCAQNVLDTTAVSVRLSSTFRDDRMVGITCTSCIRDVARFEAAKGIVERYFAERQRPEGPPSFSPWGIDAAGANSIVFSRNEAPVQYENRNFRVKNGKTGSLDPSMTTDWMERTATSSPFESIPEETAKPQGLAQRLRTVNVRTQSLDLKTLTGTGPYLSGPSPTSSHFGSQQMPMSASSAAFYNVQQ